VFGENRKKKEKKLLGEIAEKTRQKKSARKSYQISPHLEESRN